MQLLTKMSNQSDRLAAFMPSLFLVLLSFSFFCVTNYFFSQETQQVFEAFVLHLFSFVAYFFFFSFSTLFLTQLNFFFYTLEKKSSVEIEVETLVRRCLAPTSERLLEAVTESRQVHLRLYSGSIQALLRLY